MTKTYKELQEAFKSIEDKNNGVPGNMPIVATGTPMIDIYRIANSLLLEALSDKEEWKAPRPFYYDNVIGKLRWSDIHEICSDKEEKFCGGEPCICEPMMQVPKQSTSLKEETEELIYKSIYRDVLTTTETTDKVLKLIQSYLLKEILELESIHESDEYTCGYEDAKEEIIKIINNITKQT